MRNIRVKILNDGIVGRNIFYAVRVDQGSIRISGEREAPGLSGLTEFARVLVCREVGYEKRVVLGRVGEFHLKECFLPRIREFVFPGVLFDIRFSKFLTLVGHRRLIQNFFQAVVPFLAGLSTQEVMVVRAGMAQKGIGMGA